MQTLVLWATSTFLASLAFLTFTPGNAQASHLCKKGEKVLFSCRIKRKKPRFVSLCSPKNAKNKKAPSITYRYGSKKKVEMSVTHPKVAFQSRSESYSGGYGTLISFKRKGYTYSVYQKLVKVTIAKKAKIAGIEILTPKHKTIDLRCRPKSVKGHVDNVPLPKK